MTVAAILKHKGSDVASTGPSATLAEVAQQLSHARIGAVVVQDANATLLGIVSERDLIYALAANGTAALAMTAGQVMTRVVKTVTPQTSVDEAMAMMTAGRFRHLPVLRDDALAGIISIGDVVKAHILRQDQEVDSLKAYVAGAG